MRKILCLIFILVSLQAISQRPSLTQLPQKMEYKWYEVTNFFMVDSGLVVPRLDTNFIARWAGMLVRRPADGLLYMSNGNYTGKKWEAVTATGAGTGDITGGSNLGAGGVNVFNAENAGVLEFNTLSSNDFILSSNVITISTEGLQDDLFPAIVDAGSIDFTYNDVANTVSAQLLGDNASPGNSQYYGTNGSGVKGFYALPTSSTPILQQVFDVETGEAILTKADTINNGTFDFYIRSTTATTNGVRIFQQSTTRQSKGIITPSIVEFEAADYPNFNETSYFNMVGGDNAGLWFYALDNDGRTKTLNFKLLPDSLYFYPNTTDEFSLVIKGIPDKATLLGTDSVLIHDISGRVWKVPSSAIGGNGTTDLTFTGASSPYTLNSSTGTDVTFTQGSGITITRTGNDLSFSASGSMTWNGIMGSVSILGNNVTMAGSNQYVYTGVGGHTFTLPVIASNARVYFIKNRGSGNLTLDGDGTEQLYTTSAVANITIVPGESRIVAADGTYWNVYDMEPAGGSYTDEQAQDAVGTILTDGNGFNFDYNDVTPSITLTTTLTQNHVVYAGASGAITGSANLTYDGSLLTGTSAGLVTTQDDTKGFVASNSTAATAGVPVQISPSFRWSGFGWKSNATAASQEVEFRAFVQPVDAVFNPNGYWVLQSSINGGGYVTNFKISDNSNIAWNTGVITDLRNSSGSLATAGSEVRLGAINAIVLSTNAIDSSSNTAILGGQNAVLQDGAGGAVMLCTDCITWSGAIYSLNTGDAGQVRAESGTVGGFGSRTSISYSVAWGLNVYLGNTSSVIGTLNNYSEGFGFGGNIAATGNQTGNLGFKLQNTGNQAMVYGRGGALTGTNSMAGVLAFFNNSDSAVIYLKPAAGTTGTYGEVDIRGLVQDDTETRIVVAESDGTLQWRAASTLGGALNLSWDATNHEVDISGGGTSAVIPFATASVTGILSTTTQTIAGYKTFQDGISASSVLADYENAGTNSADFGFALKHTSTGTPVPGFGTGILFELETAPGNNEQGARFYTELTDVTSTSEDFDFVWQLMSDGATPTTKAKLSSKGIFYLTETTAPGTPATGFGALYTKSADGKLYWKDDAGVEYDLTLGGGSGTVNAGAAGKPAYYPSAASAVDDFAPIDFATSGTHVTITSAATTDNLLNLKSIASFTGKYLNISTSAGTGDVLTINDNKEAIWAGASDAGDYQIQLTKPYYTSVGISATYFVGNGSGSLTLKDNAGAQWIQASGAIMIYSNSTISFNASTNEKLNLSSGGARFGGSGSAATAYVHFDAGTATAGTAPLKFTAGTNLTAIENGAMEYDGTHLYISIGGVRYQLDQQSGGSAHVIKDETTSLTNRAGLAFIGTAVTAADDAAGNETEITFDAEVNGIADLATNGIVARTAAGTFAGRTITGTTDEISVANGDGVSGNPTLSLSATLNLNGKTVQVQDNNWTMQDNTTTTKKMVFELSGITAATTRTLTVPDANGIIILNDNTATLTNKTFDLTSNTLVGSVAEFNAALESDDFATLANTVTLTNKRITQRANTTASSSSLTIDSDATDVYTVTALAAAMTINNPSGTPTEGQKLIIRIKDNGTARGLTWSGTQFRAGDIAFPTTTVVNKTMYVGLIWNSTDSKWDLIAYVDNL